MTVPFHFPFHIPLQWLETLETKFPITIIILTHKTNSQLKGIMHLNNSSLTLRIQHIYQNQDQTKSEKSILWRFRCPQSHTKTWERFLKNLEIYRYRAATKSENKNHKRTVKENSNMWTFVWTFELVEIMCVSLARSDDDSVSLFQIGGWRPTSPTGDLLAWWWYRGVLNSSWKFLLEGKRDFCKNLGQWKFPAIQ